MEEVAHIRHYRNWQILRASPAHDICQQNGIVCVAVYDQRALMQRVGYCWYLETTDGGTDEDGVLDVLPARRALSRQIRQRTTRYKCAK